MPVLENHTELPADAAVPAESDLAIDVQVLDEGLPLPSYAHGDDAGLDLRAATACRIEPGERCVVGTGIAMAIPPGYAGFVHPRSGLAARHGVTTLNSPGTIDSGYTGEIKVILLNTDAHSAVELARGDRIAQLVVQRIAKVQLRVVGSLEGSARGAGGFGSTGGFPAGQILKEE